MIVNVNDDDEQHLYGAIYLFKKNIQRRERLQ